MRKINFFGSSCPLTLSSIASCNFIVFVADVHHQPRRSFLSILHHPTISLPILVLFISLSSFYL